MAEQVQTHPATENDLLSRTFGAIGPIVGGAILVVDEMARRLAHERSIKPLTDRMRSESRFTLSAAADFLERANQTALDITPGSRFDQQRPASDESYAAAQVIHYSVGALEETARQIAGMSGKRLPHALRWLTEAGTITSTQAELMEQVYLVRSRTPGVAHGAGEASNAVALRVFEVVQAGTAAILFGAGVGAALTDAPDGRRLIEGGRR